MGETVDLSNLSDEEWEQYKRSNDAILAGKGKPSDAAFVAAARTSAPSTIQSPTVIQEAEAERDAPGATPAQRAEAEATLARWRGAAPPPAVAVAAPSPEKTAMPTPSGIAGGVHQAITLSKWSQMAQQIKDKYPGVAKKMEQAGGVAKAIAPAMPGIGGTAAAIGNAATEPPRPSSPEQPAPSGDPATDMSDRAKAIASAGGISTSGGGYAPGPTTPFRTIPGHWQDSTRVTKESQLTPEEAESIRRGEQSAMGHRGEALEHMDEAGKQKAFVDASYSRWRNDFERQNAADEEMAAARRAQVTSQKLAQLNDSMSQYDASVQDLGKARQGLFANKVANGPPVANAIFGVLAGAMGIASFITGRQNPITDLIKTMDESSQKDIDAQARVVDAAGHRVGLARNAYSKALHALGDEDAARAAVRAQHYKYAAAQADMMMSGAKTEEQKQGLSEAKARFMNEANKSTEDVARLTNAQVTRDEKYVPTHTVGGGPMAGFLNTTPGQIVGRPAGGDVAVRSEKAAQQIQDRQAMEKTLGRTLKRLNELDRNASVADHVNPRSEYNRERARLVATLIPQLSQAQDKSVVRDSEVKRIEEAAGGRYTVLDKLLGREPMAGDAAKALEGGSEELIDAQHGVGVQEVLVPNPKTGQIEQKYIPLQQDAKARPSMPASARKVK